MIYVIRPYGDWIREHIFAILEEAGIATGQATVVQDPTTVEEIVSQYQGLDPDFVLLPYHAKGGINGLDILLALHQQNLVSHHLPILMPISIYAAAGFNLSLNKLNQQDRAWFDQSVCVEYGPFDDHTVHAEFLKNYLRERL